MECNSKYSTDQTALHKHYRWFKKGRKRCIVPMCPNIFGYFTTIKKLRSYPESTQLLWIHSIRSKNELFNEVFPPGTRLPCCSGVCSLHFDTEELKNVPNSDNAATVEEPRLLLSVEELYNYTVTLMKHGPEWGDDNSTEYEEFFKSVVFVDSDDDGSEDKADDDDVEPSVVNLPIMNELGDEDDTILVEDDDESPPPSKIRRVKESSIDSKTERQLDLDISKESARAVWLMKMLVTRSQSRSNDMLVVPSYKNISVTDESSESMDRRLSLERGKEREHGEVSDGDDSTPSPKRDGCVTPNAHDIVDEFVKESDLLIPQDLLVELPNKGSEPDDDVVEILSDDDDDDDETWTPALHKKRKEKNTPVSNPKPYQRTEEFPPYLFRLPPAYTQKSVMQPVNNIFVPNFTSQQCPVFTQNSQQQETQQQNQSPSLVISSIQTLVDYSQATPTAYIDLDDDDDDQPEEKFKQEDDGYLVEGDDTESKVFNLNEVGLGPMTYVGEDGNTYEISYVD